MLKSPNGIVDEILSEKLDSRNFIPLYLLPLMFIDNELKNKNEELKITFLTIPNSIWMEFTFKIIFFLKPKIHSEYHIFKLYS